ncbi:hypothetical protein ACLMJK_004010 [Lecanora helva]
MPITPEKDTFDLQYSLPMSKNDKLNPDPHPELNLDDDLDFFNSGMAGTGHSSPFIKDEPEDFPYLFSSNQRGPNMQMGQNFGQNSTGNIDPSDLTMAQSNYGQYGSSSQQNMSNSLTFAHSGINDDELLDLDFNNASNQQSFPDNHPNFRAPNAGQNYYPQQTAMNAGGQNTMNQLFSHTPDGGPIQSPFTNGNFNYAQFAHMQSQQMRPNALAMQNSHNARSGAQLAQSMDRQHSDSRSPMTPKTPGLNALNLGTPESGSLPSQPIHTNFRGHHNRLSSQFDAAGSYGESPVSSPNHPASHAQISEVLKSGKHASLPAKVENNHHPIPAYQTQEAKRRRRRESHNMVERRRRDNINEKIQELSHLVPMHRLEDEKVRKHLANNSPMSPTLVATGKSPEQATSLLAGGGRRATGAGSISMGIPPEDKDKGPNKGDILNGAVSWTRDLMWSLHVKLQQEAELVEYIESLGGTFPFQPTEDEKRMRTELLNAMQENNADTFSYTRTHGTGLRVPDHTNAAGEPINQGNTGTLSPRSMSPGQPLGESLQTHPQYWNSSLKEEDEYGMDMN